MFSFPLLLVCLELGNNNSLLCRILSPNVTPQEVVLLQTDQAHAPLGTWLFHLLRKLLPRFLHGSFPRHLQALGQHYLLLTTLSQHS